MKKDTSVTIEAALVNRCITAIMTAILAIGGYMVAWGIADAKWKGEVVTRLTAVENLLDVHDTYRKQSDQSVKRLDDVEQDLENHIDRGH